MAETPTLAKCNHRLRTCTGWTVFFMVLLRVAIGWHFFYEGIWKLKQDDWRATSYLVMSMGPMRNVFRSMVKDVDGLEQLTAQGMKDRMDQRYDALIKRYGIEDAKLLESIKAFTATRKGAAEKDAEYINLVNASSAALANTLYGDFVNWRGDLAATTQPADEFAENDAKVVIEAELTKTPGFKARTLEHGASNEHLAQSVKDFFEDRDNAQHIALLKEGFTNTLRGSRMNYVESIFEDADFCKQIEDYKTLLKEVSGYEQKLGTTGFNKERLLDQYARKAKSKAACLAVAEKPLKDLDVYLFGNMAPAPPKPGVLPKAFLDAKVANDPKADSLYSTMLAKGLPKYPSPTSWIDWSNMIALTAVGAGLILGLFTRLSALGGIGLLMMYYWCMPSLPWLPEAGPLEGHYLFVNKNIIEALALAMIACSGVGRWAGLDAFLFRGRRLDKVTA